VFTKLIETTTKDNQLHVIPMCLKDYFLLIVLLEYKQQLIICLIKTTNIMLQRKFDEKHKTS